MKNNIPGHISEKELDSLINKAFLNLDFESNVTNKEVLEIVANKTFRKNSFFKVFNSRRFNLLFLFLSALIFATSFYRFTNSLLAKENNEMHPALEVKFLEIKMPLIKPALINYPIKNIINDEQKHTSQPNQITQSLPVKSNYSPEKKIKKIIPAPVLAMVIKDSTTVVTEPESEIKKTDVLAIPNKVDSLVTSSQKVLPPSALKSKNTSPKTSRNIKPLKPETKGKLAKRRKAKKLFRNGTFTMTNRKYGKSR